jgi:hypothetical protein
VHPGDHRPPSFPQQRMPPMIRTQYVDEQAEVSSYLAIYLRNDCQLIKNSKKLQLRIRHWPNFPLIYCHFGGHKFSKLKERPKRKHLSWSCAH